MISSLAVVLIDVLPLPFVTRAMLNPRIIPGVPLAAHSIPTHAEPHGRRSPGADPKDRDPPCVGGTAHAVANHSDSIAMRSIAMVSHQHLSASSAAEHGLPSSPASRLAVMPTGYLSVSDLVTTLQVAQDSPSTAPSLESSSLLWVAEF